MATSSQKRLGVAVTGLLSQWQGARQKLIRRKAGRSAVHQWRVCSRQLFALEELLAPDTGRHRGSLHDRLHAAFHAAGKLRDAQLAVRSLKTLSPEFPAADRLLRHLQRRIPRQRERVVRHVRSIKPRAVRNVLRSWGILEHQDVARLNARAALRLRRVQQQLLRGQSHLDTTHALHRHRVHLKSLLYMRDFSRAAGLRVPRLPAMSGTGSMQRSLGDIADLRALTGLLDRFTARHPAWRRRSAKLRQHLQRQGKSLAVAPLHRPAALPSSVSRCSSSR